MELYLLIILILGLCVPLLLHPKLKRRISNTSFLTILEILIGFTVILVGIILPFYFFFSSIEYPTKTKVINQKYYFNQTEYGMAWTDPGKHLDFYENQKFWFDRKLGHIQWLWGTSDLNAQIINNPTSDFNRLILTERDKVVLDTVINIENGFDFKFLPKE